MVEQQQKLVLSPYMEIYDLVVPKDNLLRQIKELVDFGFVYDELIEKYCLKVSNPHFKWGFIINPSGVCYWFRQRRGFTVPLLLVTLLSRALYFLAFSNLSFSSCS